MSLMKDENPTVSDSDVINEALSWIGTPYRHQASCKGAGCDCLGLIRGVYGHFWRAPETPPAYSPDWAENGGRETLNEAAKRYLLPVELSKMRPGCVLLFRYRLGFPAKHTGILVENDRFIHAQHGAQVALVSLGSWWRRHIAYVFSFPTAGSSNNQVTND